MATTPRTEVTALPTRWNRLDREDLIRAFRVMHTARRLDDREILLKRQNRIFFQISRRRARSHAGGGRHDSAAGPRLVLSRTTATARSA